MYQSYFGLAEAPFSIAPDPRYLYMSERHQEALAHLLYGVNGSGGFVLLTGEVGAGKTTVCRCLLEQIPESCDVAYIFNPRQTVEELLLTICIEFGIAYPPGNTSVKVFVDCINTYLLDAHARGRHTVLVIDEAQNLSADVLEQMRLLTNLETSQRKLLQIILLGQSELAEMLARPELRQLAQRVIARYHLGPLSKQEVAAYVRHRLGVAGTQRTLFPDSLMSSLYKLSGGTPRVINVLCDRALLGAYVQAKERVDQATLKQAAREVFHHPQKRSRNIMFVLLAGLLASTALAALLYKPDVQSPVPAKVEPAKPAAPVAETPAILEWPAAEPLQRSKEMAYTALFRAWGADYQEGDECLQAEALGLKCLSARGGLDELRQMNRPAVLQLSDKQGRKFHATLTLLDDRVAVFNVGNETRAVAIGALAEQWSGQYTLLWRKPPVEQQQIRPGDRGPDVEWLRNQLAQINGTVADATQEPVFDEAMVRQVRQFQLAHDLPPIGIAGPQTILRLSGVADMSAPKLVTGQRGK
ncbi:MAG: AAA family ATPase [Gammaproteobacteria bacterium]|nr:AAA family ATPase [Gammaproteobacteria bacterium]MBU1480106.1 AAA family ATPase [Gammaproteobacteria bacterium]